MAQFEPALMTPASTELARRLAVLPEITSHSEQLHSPPTGSPRWQKVIWAAFLVAFVVVGSGVADDLCGCLGLREMRNRVRVARAGPQSSTDTVFLRTLGVENASARIAACLQGLPPGEPVAIVYQNAPLSGLDALLIGSIAWPHPIPQIALNPGESLDNARLEAVNATRAVFFLGMPRPNASEHVRSLSPLMHFYRSPSLPPAR